MAIRQQTLAMFMLIALAFATSTMTALRLPGVPIGISELILIGCMIVHLPFGLDLHGNNVPNRFVPLLFLLFVAMLPGYFATLMRDGEEPGALYNLIASAWVVVVFAYLHFGFDYRRVELERLVQLVLGFSTFYFVVVLALSVLEPSAVYREDNVAELLVDAETRKSALAEEQVFRLVGFAINPNQLALHALVCSFFAIAMWRRNGTLLSLGCFGVAAVTGYYARSDAFLFAEIALVGITVVMGILFHRSVILVLMLLVPAAIAFFLMLSPIVIGIQEIASTSDQDVTRFTLWENGVAAGLEHPLIGLGPGAWSGLDGPRGAEEAHNSIIDYFSNAGLLGSTLLLVGLTTLLFRAVLSRRAVFLAGAVSIILFAMFHNVLRQPIMWLGLYYVAQNVWPGARVKVEERGRARRRRRRRVRSHSSARQPI